MLCHRFSNERLGGGRPERPPLLFCKSVHLHFRSVYSSDFVKNVYEDYELSLPIGNRRIKIFSELDGPIFRLAVGLELLFWDDRVQTSDNKNRAPKC